MNLADATAATEAAVASGLHGARLRLYAYLCHILDPCVAQPAKQMHLAFVLGYDQSQVCRMLGQLVTDGYLTTTGAGKRRRRKRTRALKLYRLTYGADQCAADPLPVAYSRTA